MSGTYEVLAAVYGVTSRNTKAGMSMMEKGLRSIAHSLARDRVHIDRLYVATDVSDAIIDAVDQAGTEAVRVI